MMFLMASYFMLFLCCLFSLRDVLDEIWDGIKSVPDNFPNYSESTRNEFANNVHPAEAALNDNDSSTVIFWTTLFVYLSK